MPCCVMLCMLRMYAHYMRYVCMHADMDTTIYGYIYIYMYGSDMYTDTDWTYTDMYISGNGYTHTRIYIYIYIEDLILGSP